eukprot:4196395-Prymnesium_polylepis.3
MVVLCAREANDFALRIVGQVECIRHKAFGKLHGFAREYTCIKPEVDGLHVVPEHRVKAIE